MASDHMNGLVEEVARIIEQRAAIAVSYDSVQRRYERVSNADELAAAIIALPAISSLTDELERVRLELAIAKKLAEPSFKAFEKAIPQVNWPKAMPVQVIRPTGVDSWFVRAVDGADFCIGPGAYASLIDPRTAEAALAASERRVESMRLPLTWAGAFIEGVQEAKTYDMTAAQEQAVEMLLSNIRAVLNPTDRDGSSRGLVHDQVAASGSLPAHAPTQPNLK